MKQLKKRLTINKETVANLDESQLKDVKGGATHTLPTDYCTLDCTGYSCTCHCW